MHGSYFRHFHPANWFVEIVTFALTWPMALFLSFTYSAKGEESGVGNDAPCSSLYDHWAQDPLRCQARFTQDYFGRWSGW